VTAPLVQRLSLVVDAATGNTETRMDAVAAASRDAGEAAERSAGQVAAAADRVAAAQLKRDDAAGKVTVAETRLLELQEKGNASASQLAAATERLESARRGLAVAERQVEAAQGESAAVQARATEATARQATESERARGGSERLRGQLDGLKDAAKGLTAFAVGDWLQEQVSGYLEGARGAQALATSMNASVEEGGRLAVIFQSLGLEADDLLEIQAQFASTSKDGLTAAGNELKTNRDGTVNWAQSLQDALGQLQQIPDATERNRQGFQMFGEEGYKQLSRLLTSGVSVEEAFRRVGTPFTAEDVRTAQQFDAQMMQLNLSSSDLGRTLARTVVPATTGLVDGVNSVVGAVSQIPLPLGLATTAAVILGQTGFDPVARTGEFVRDRVSAMREAISTATGSLDADAGRMAKAGATIRSGLGAGISAVGGPVGVATIAIGAVAAVAEATADSVQRRVDQAVERLNKAEASVSGFALTAHQAAVQAQADSGWLENYQVGAGELGSEIDDAGGAVSFFNNATGGMAGTLLGLGATVTGQTGPAVEGYRRRIDDAREKLGEFGAQTAAAQLTTAGLTQMIAEGDTSSQAFADAVRDAAAAETAQTTTSDTASAAIAAYHAQTDQAVQSVRGLIDAQLGQQDAGYAFLSSMDALNAATDDAKTSVDEVAQAHTQLQEAALRAGDAAAETAVAQARAAGSIVTPLDEAKVRADALIDDLTARLNTPGLSQGAKDDLQGLIDQLTTAREKGDVKALVTLTGVDEAEGQLDSTTADRDTQVRVESRGGPAVKAYLDGLASDRLALIRTESRGGPAVNDYLGGLASDRLAIIRVETRGGPDVDRYLDDLAGQRRTAVIDVQRRNAPGAGGGGPAGAGLLGAGAGGTYTVNVYPQTDAGGRMTAQALQLTGGQVVGLLREYERRNGPGWRR
jgi:hypothetical protein